MRDIDEAREFEVGSASDIVANTALISKIYCALHEMLHGIEKM
jgi:hypothetical protein